MGRLRIEPTDRHRELARRVTEVVVDQPFAADLEAWVAQLLADEDAGRVPIEAVSAAYGRGRRDAARRVVDELARRADRVDELVAGELRGLEAWAHAVLEQTPAKETPAP